MGTRNVVYDDITGEEGAETVVFGLKGQQYRIDLTPDAEGSTALDEALAEFIEKAVPVQVQGRSNGGRKRASGGGGGRSRSADAQNRERTERIRGWAREQGMEVSERGRISNDVKQAYERAHPNDTAVQESAEEPAGES